MAEHPDVEYATAAGNDYAEHERTYERFVSLVKWNAYGLVVLLSLMAFFLL